MLTFARSIMIYRRVWRAMSCLVFPVGRGVQDESFATAAKADKKAKKENIECFSCKKKGHYQSEYWAAQSSILGPYELCMSDLMYGWMCYGRDWCQRKPRI